MGSAKSTAIQFPSRKAERTEQSVCENSVEQSPSISDDQNQPTAEEERKSGKEFQRPSFLDTIEPHSISREIYTPYMDDQARDNKRGYTVRRSRLNPTHQIRWACRAAFHISLT